MSNKIIRLDNITVNQIAAGEVIENAASVVKELVENAVDAGSKNIRVDVLGGGKQLVRVSDDGCGMSQEDALLCFERNATSKVSTFDDLQLLSTMGFRGEAIPSIASVSKVVLMTSTGDQGDIGTMVVYEGGKLIRQDGVIRRRGTTFEVKSLFFNVPVRRRFQRSPQQEEQALQSLFRQLALAHPYVNFIFHTEKHQLEYRVSAELQEVVQKKKRLLDVLGSAYCDACQFIECTNGLYSLVGWIGKPNQSRKNRLGQHLLVNHRSIGSNLLTHAVKAGYGSMIDEREHPLFALYLNLPSGHVDVNVHPQKSEVRFRRELELRDWIMQAISKTLQCSRFSGGGREKTEDMSPLSTQTGRPPNFPPTVTKTTSLPVITPQSKPAISVKKPLIPSVAPAHSAQFLGTQSASKRVSENQTHSALERRLNLPPRVLGCLKGYLILDASGCHELTPSLQARAGDLVLFDQRAARELVFYEEWKQHSGVGGRASIRLLFPLTLNFHGDEREVFAHIKEKLEFQGFEFQLKEQNLFVVAVPIQLRESDVEEYISLAIRVASENLPLDELNDCLAKEMAITHGGRACMMPREEGEGLVATWMRLGCHLFSPTGRAIIAVLPAENLAQYFSKSPIS
ncbi:MAG: DNA mismatch repair endonuclease MutL [Chlamydiia bacterium]|nr:DNA mismatch repair endonuclease MutL [Chlamydiia bacterium]